MNFEKINTYYDPWPHLIIEEFISQKFAQELKNEILNFDNFDDTVMVNRQRINKGSKNFEKILSSSINIKKIYEFLNNDNTFKTLLNFFKADKLNWKFNNNYKSFSKDYFGKQQDSISENIIKFLANKNFIGTKLNLDIDFSVSGKGYYRGPHRDRDTRVLNFLLYLNNFNLNDGGAFEIFDYEKNHETNQHDYPRFPEAKHVKISKTVQPVEGKMVIFLSTPNSYHAASQFIAENKKRVFVYGSYSFNRKVDWTKNNF